MKPQKIYLDFETVIANTPDKEVLRLGVQRLRSAGYTVVTYASYALGTRGLNHIIRYLDTAKIQVDYISGVVPEDAIIISANAIHYNGDSFHLLEKVHEFEG